jgi:uncharacterized protein (TIGR02594 family)
MAVAAAVGVRSLRLAALLVPVALAACSSDPGASEVRGATESAIKGGAANARVSGTGKTGLHVRTDASTSSAVLSTLEEGSRFTVKCRKTGQAVGGNSSWDFVPNTGGWVAERFVTKLGGDFPTCEDDGSAAAAPATAPATAASGDDTGAALVTEARKWIGTHETGDNCNPFSSALGRPCEAWCSDFVNYVWQTVGVKTDDVTAYAGSFLTYGQENGTLKDLDSTDVKPGDAVVWANSADDAAHVGMVSEVLDNGDLRVINGNYADDVEETVSKRTSQVSGMGIAGFVSPAAQ